MLLIVNFQFSSVAQSCPTLFDPMNRSTPGLPVHHKLQKFTQTHVHRVGDATQPSHLLSSPSPPAPNPSQHQGLFQWVNSSHEVAKVLEFPLQHQSFQWTSIPFLSFIKPIFAWNVPLVSLIFLKRSLVFSILLFSSIALHWSLRKGFLSLLAILWNSAFKWEYPSFSPLLLASLLFTAICKASSDSHFAFLHLFSMGMVLIPVSCTTSWTIMYILPNNNMLNELVSKRKRIP